MHNYCDISWTQPSSCLLIQYKKLLSSLFWINIIHIYKMFLYLFHCKECKKNHLITVVLRSLAVGKARGSQDKLTCNSTGLPFLLHLRTPPYRRTGWIPSFLSIAEASGLSYTRDICYQLQGRPHGVYHTVSKITAFSLHGVHCKQYLKKADFWNFYTFKI